MKKSSIVSFISILCILPLSAGAQLIQDSGWIYDKDLNSDGKGDSGKMQSVCRGSNSSCQREIIFNTVKMKRSLRYNICTDKSHIKKKGCQGHTLSMAGIGMSDVAWHINGFIDISIDGCSVSSYIPEIKTEENKDHGKAIYLWTLPNGKVKLTFTAEYGDDFFTVGLKFSNMAPDHKREVMFLCYPSSLEKNRERFCVTAKRNLSHGIDKSWQTLSQEEYWVAYGDRYWDLGIKENTGKCDGPCALLYLPDEYRKVEIQVSNYEIYTHFICGNGNEFNFMLWPSMKISNAEFIDKMKLLTIRNNPE